jgi:hypothetical protein
MESELRSAWLGHLLSTETTDRPRAESGFRDLYSEGGFTPRLQFFWFDSPFTAACAAFLLSTAHDSFHRRLLNDFNRERRHRERIDGVRATLCKSAQLDWEDLTATAGGIIMAHCWIPNDPTRVRNILPELAKARQQICQDGEAADSKFHDRDPLHRAEKSMTSVLKSYAGFGPGVIIDRPLAVYYSFSEMAMDEATALHMEAPPLLAAAWNVSRCAGRWWWPFFGCVVLSERPIEIHVNEQSLLHRPDGPALVYRDGTRVWAWEGGCVEEDLMLHPEISRPHD